MFEDKLVASVKSYIFQHMKLPEDFSFEKVFPDNNETNAGEDKDDEFFKKQLISELNDSYISGFATAESLIESFNDPSKQALTNPSFSVQEVLLCVNSISNYKVQQASIAEASDCICSIH